MSCMLLDPQHIAAIVGSVDYHSPHSSWEPDLRSLTETANDLARVNAKARGDRYSFSTKEEPVTVTGDMIEAWHKSPLSIADTNAAIRCYQYQASDWGGWRGSEEERLVLYMQRILLDVSAGVSMVWTIEGGPEERGTKDSSPLDVTA